MREGIVVLTFSVGCYYHIRTKGFPTTSNLDLVAFAVPRFNVIIALIGTEVR